jgi:hypothetical protein
MYHRGSIETHPKGDYRRSVWPIIEISETRIQLSLDTPCAFLIAFSSLIIKTKHAQTAAPAGIFLFSLLYNLFYSLHVPLCSPFSTLLLAALSFIGSFFKIQLLLSMLVFWVVTPCVLVGRYQRFGGTCCLHLQE